MPGEPWRSYEEAEAAIRALGGWRVTKKMSGYGFPDASLEHIATAEALAKQNSAEEQKWADAKPVFVRYGKPPKGGRSLNHVTGEYEQGVSVFNGQVLPSGEARALPRTNQELATGLWLRNLPLYVVSGKLVGQGSDGEPLLSNVRIVRQAKVVSLPPSFM